MHTIYTTFENKKVAELFILKIIKLGFAKCANFLPITSVYRWKGKVVKETEIAVLFKTIEAKKLVTYLENNHPYEIPIIEILDSSKVNKKYLAWLKEIDL